MSCLMKLVDDPGEDDCASFAAALEDAGKLPGSTMLMPPGMYHITTALARWTLNDALSGRYGKTPRT